jgi:hypothetical protein
MTVLDGDILVVVIEASGVPVPGSYPTRLARGSCGSGGETAATLDPLTGLADRTGESTTTLDAAADFLTGPLFIEIRGPGDVPLSCGELPPHRTLPTLP